MYYCFYYSSRPYECMSNTICSYTKDAYGFGDIDSCNAYFQQLFFYYGMYNGYYGGYQACYCTDGSWYLRDYGYYAAGIPDYYRGSYDRWYSDRVEEGNLSDYDIVSKPFNADLSSTFGVSSSSNLGCILSAYDSLEIQTAYSN